MKYATKLMTSAVIAALMVPAIGNAAGAGKSANAKVRGMIDLSAGPIKQKRICNHESEIYRASDVGPVKESSQSQTDSVVTYTELPGGEILRTSVGMGSYTNDGYRYESKHRVEGRIKQKHLGHGWIEEVGDVVSNSTPYSTEVSTEEFKQRRHQYKEVFRFEGDQRVTKSYVSTDDPAGNLTLRQYVYQKSPTSYVEIFFEPSQVDAFYTDGDGKVLEDQPYKVLRETVYCTVDAIK